MDRDFPDVGTGCQLYDHQMKRSENYGLMIVGLSAFVALTVLAAFGLGVFVGSRMNDAGDVNAVGLVPPTLEQPSTTLAIVSPVVILDGCESVGSVPIVCVVGVFVINEQIEVKLEYVGFEPSMMDLHAHVYAGSQSVADSAVADSAGGGGGMWQVTDSDRLVLSTKDGVGAQILVDGEVCVATATAEHKLLHYGSSCLQFSG